RFRDALRLVLVEEPELGVHERGRRLDATKPTRDRDGNRLAGDPKVLDGLARLSAPQSTSFVRLGHETESSFGLHVRLLPGGDRRAPLLDRVVTQHAPKRFRERLRLGPADVATACARSEEHTSELQSLAYLVCRLLLEKKKKNN